MEKHGENNQNIESISRINAQNIDLANYFMSLTGEAVAVGILSENEVVYMQSQISDILADVIWQYNGGSSTSVTTEAAADLIESIVFALDCFCISICKDDSICSIDEKCLEMLKEKAGIKNAHQKGIKYIAQIFNDAKKIYNELYLNKLNIGISLYNATINKEFILFFKKYDTQLFSHRINPLFDYPLALSGEIKDYKGILYVHQYLKYLTLENEFCSLFDIKDIQHLMKNYANNNGFTLSELMENIFEKVFLNSLFCVLLDSDNISLSIKREEYNKIAEKLYDNDICKDEIYIKDLINEYTKKLMINLKINNPKLQIYILKYQKKFTKNILSAIQKKYLHNFIIYNQ